MRIGYVFIRQIARFKNAANVVQARYGASNKAAAVDRWKKVKVVAAIASQRIRISPNAGPGLRNPKKMADQATFNPSCNAKRVSGTRDADQPPRRQTSQAATAIIKYSAVQTGPNNQSGGLQEGLTSV